MKLLVHAHTTFSHDGHLTPRALGDLARKKGFDGVLLSDHFEDLDRSSFAALVTECERVSACRLIPGYERDWGGFHICAFGVRDWIDVDEIKAWSDRMRQMGALLCLAHPSRYRHNVPHDVLSACDAVEVWNTKRPYDGIIGPHPDAYNLLGDRLALVGQDLHRTSDAKTVGIEIVACKTAEDMLDVIRKREYMTSSHLYRTLEAPSAVPTAILRVLHPIRRWMWIPPIKTYRAARRIGLPNLNSP